MVDKKLEGNKLQNRLTLQQFTADLKWKCTIYSAFMTSQGTVVYFIARRSTEFVLGKKFTIPAYTAFSCAHEFTSAK